MKSRGLGLFPSGVVMVLIGTRVSIVAISVMLALPGRAEAPTGHEAHHPSKMQPEASKPGAPAPSTPAPSTPAPSPPAPSPPADGMGEMMRKMGAPPPKELYPSIMSLPPELPSEKRDELLRQARERMTAGKNLLSESMAALSEATARDDIPAAEDATARMRQGLAQFESGFAAHRALADGKALRNVALEWFRREMTLRTKPSAEAPYGLFGLSWFHYVVMLILLTFAGAMIRMSFRRMSRTEALLTSLTTGKRIVSEFAPAAPPPRAPGAPADTVAGSAAYVTPGPAAYKVVAPAGLPAGRWSGQLRVAQIFQETADVRTFRLMHPAGGDLPFVFQPGQFLTISVTTEGKEAKRSYSIASSPCCRGWCEITVKHAPHGAVSAFLHEQVKAGDLLEASGPYGKFSFRGAEAPNIVFIAGGVGITPLMSALRYLTDQSWAGGIFLVYACASLKDVIYREELEYLVRRHPNLHVTFVLSDETSPLWTGPRGFITKELLMQAVPDLSDRLIHLCGPPPMMQAVKSILSEVGVPPEQVKTETFLTPEPGVPRPPGAPISAPSAVAAPICSFVRSGKTALLPADKTILDASEDVGVNIEYSCRQGYCGVCKIKLLSGQVTMAVDDGLAAEDKALGFILACQARASADVAVEA